jgi:hypothetical protein
VTRQTESRVYDRRAAWRPRQPTQARARAFVMVGSVNLHDTQAPHMRLMSMTLVDRDHFSERWTKIEAGKETVFQLNFTRR